MWERIFHCARMHREIADRIAGSIRTYIVGTHFQLCYKCNVELRTGQLDPVIQSAIPRCIYSTMENAFPQHTMIRYILDVYI